MQSVSASFLAEWNKPTSRPELKAWKTGSPDTELICTTIRIARKRNYKLAAILAGEMTITVQASSSYSLSVGDTIYVTAGYNNETITIFTGFIDRVSWNIKTNQYDVKMRDRLKLLQRFKISPSEEQNASIKDLLDIICDEIGVDAGDRDFDDPSINVKYWAPDSELAYDEVQKLIEASVDADFYADEEGVLIYRNYAPGTQLTETWDSDSDFTTKQTSNSNWQISGGKLNPKFNASTQKLTTTTGTKDVTGTSAGSPLHEEITTIFKIQADHSGKLSEIAWDFLALGGPGTGVSIANDIVVKVYNASNVLQATYNIDNDQTYSADGSDNRYIDINDAIDLTSGQTILYRTNWYIEFTITYVWSGVNYTVDKKLDGTKYSSIAGFTVTNQSTAFLARSLDASLTYFNFTETSAFISSVKVMPLELSYSYESDGIPTNMTEWGTFEVTDSGHGFQYYLKTSADDSTYSSAVNVTKNTNLEGVVSHANYHRWGVTFTASDDPEFYVDLVRMNWFVGGTADRFNKSVATTIQDVHIIEGIVIETDEVGGSGALINSIEVRSQPRYEEGSATTVWQGTVDGDPVAAGNTYVLSAAQDITILCDLEQNVSEATQAIAKSVSAGSLSTETLTAHSTKPSIHLVAGGSGVTLTDFRITGKRILEAGNIMAVEEDSTSISAYGEQKESIENNYISYLTIAQAIAELYIRYYKDPRRLLELTLKLSPHLQIGDRVTVTSTKAGINEDFIIIEIRHNINISRNGWEGTTQLTLWEIR